MLGFYWPDPEPTDEQWEQAEATFRLGGDAALRSLVITWEMQGFTHRGLDVRERNRPDESDGFVRWRVVMTGSVERDYAW